jgi:hypothetical protein
MAENHVHVLLPQTFDEYPRALAFHTGFSMYVSFSHQNTVQNRKGHHPSLRIMAFSVASLLGRQPSSAAPNYHLYHH